MPVPGLTNRRIHAARPKNNPYFIWDRNPRGLGLKVATTGRRTFVVNTTRKGVRHIETIGKAESMPLAQARAIAKARIKEFTEVRNPDPGTPFEAVAEIVFQGMERLWKPSTFISNRCYLDKNILPWFKGRAISSIARNDVEEWFVNLQARPGAANRCAPILSVIMQEAEDMGLRAVGSNPVAGLRRYRRPRKERVLTSVEMANLGKALERRKAKAPLQTALVLLLVLTGCRLGEIRNLHSRDYRDGKLHLRDTKTGPRTIFLCSHARSVLDSITPKRPGLVFPQKRTGGIGIEIKHFWSNLRKEIGLDDVRLHDLRHNYASVAIRSGESLTVIGMILGHNKPDTTLRYAHLDDGMMHDAVERVSGALAGVKKGEVQ